MSDNSTAYFRSAAGGHTFRIHYNTTLDKQMQVVKHKHLQMFKDIIAQKIEDPKLEFLYMKNRMNITAR